MNALNLPKPPKTLTLRRSADAWACRAAAAVPADTNPDTLAEAVRTHLAHLPLGEYTARVAHVAMTKRNATR